MGLLEKLFGKKEETNIVSDDPVAAKKKHRAERKARMASIIDMSEPTDQFPTDGLEDNEKKDA